MSKDKDAGQSGKKTAEQSYQDLLSAAARILKVPKEEIDAQEQEWKQRKACKS